MIMAKDKRIHLPHLPKDEYYEDLWLHYCTLADTTSKKELIFVNQQMF